MQDVCHNENALYKGFIHCFLNQLVIKFTTVVLDLLIINDLSSGDHFPAMVIYFTNHDKEKSEMYADSFI